MCGTKSFDISCDFEVLYLTVIDNIDYFYFIRDKYWYANNFVSLLRELLSHLQWYEFHIRELYDEAHHYDFRTGVHGNGFRSFILIYERCFSECYEFSKRLSSVRSSFFFRPSNYIKNTESLVSVLDGLRPALKYIRKMLEKSKTHRQLMADKFFTAEELMKECGALNQLGFYGRHQGFYYCASMRRILQGVGVIVATFSDLYQNSGGPISRAISAVLNGIKYVCDPELRAQQIVDVAQNSSVEFLKAFWSLSEIHFMKKLPSWVCPKLEVREEIFIPSEPITLRNLESDDFVTIPAPSSHVPPMPVRCLLLSSVARQGQINNKMKSSCKEMSQCLIFHCHGGGFISQNPESHEIYLRHWAHDLNVPILTIDYTLSPGAPFPRALEEVLLAYAWSLKNAEKLGWTGDVICFAGDSAGGNILMGIVLKTIALKIRQPDAVLCSYTPLVLDLVPSPSRLLCWLDPLLPLGFMISCLDSYAGDMQTDGDEYDEEPHDISAPRSRKISSISEIFDSSLMFLNECEWIEVEANEPCAIDSDIPSVYHEDKNSFSPNLNNYVSSLMNSNNQHFKTLEPNLLEEAEQSVFNFPHDVIFDIKAKCQAVASEGLNKLTETLMSTLMYQKIISPLVPYKEFSNQAKRKSLISRSEASVLKKIKKLKIVSRNPFMSPLLASDDFFKQMPPVYFISLNFDPCLDDSIQFAKRLTTFNRHVVLDVLDGLPHGFLNFLPFSQEAHNGSNLCVRRLREAMKLL